MKRVFIVCMFLGLWGCTKKAEVEGLWELEEIDIDGWTRHFKPMYLKFDADKTFSVSRQQGDLTGLYKLSNATLFLTSDDTKWFNTNWTAHNYYDQLFLRGTELGYRTTQLTFKKVDRFPSFEEFADKLNGTWQLYKISENRAIQNVASTYFQIEGNNYSILENKRVIETGKVVIDARHQKISFVDAEIEWDAWFFGRELRLENKKLDIYYRLKKTKD